MDCVRRTARWVVGAGLAALIVSQIGCSVKFETGLGREHAVDWKGLEGTYEVRCEGLSAPMIVDVARVGSAPDDRPDASYAVRPNQVMALLDNGTPMKDRAIASFHTVREGLRYADVQIDSGDGFGDHSMLRITVYGNPAERVVLDQLDRAWLKDRIMEDDAASMVDDVVHADRAAVYSILHSTKSSPEAFDDSGRIELRKISVGDLSRIRSEAESHARIARAEEGNSPAARDIRALKNAKPLSVSEYLSSIRTATVTVYRLNEGEAEPGLEAELMYEYAAESLEFRGIRVVESEADLTENTADVVLTVGLSGDRFRGDRFLALYTVRASIRESVGVSGAERVERHWASPAFGFGLLAFEGKIDSNDIQQTVERAIGMMLDAQVQTNRLGSTDPTGWARVVDEIRRTEPYADLTSPALAPIRRAIDPSTGYLGSLHVRAPIFGISSVHVEYVNDYYKRFDIGGVQAQIRSEIEDDWGLVHSLGNPSDPRAVRVINLSRSFTVQLGSNLSEFHVTSVMLVEPYCFFYRDGALRTMPMYYRIVNRDEQTDGQNRFELSKTFHGITRNLTSKEIRPNIVD